ncbi:rod shape-determining protein MreC [Enterobacteriaceae endosymbiont of Donacia cincticornis]|uniref:rod shape-determining protein MreC n=1 Tax=Enterobacteriaceae endosymbiont of Donacia cincticornis TaxID=2675773 RepID=UPI001448C974|nr:rod shape-determining protein MreC [Enterobacteriaceae endosymbiont of Donacia cincticornis]QJC35921.1 rod shape-determining protein MreC [Enterobacteriaceae endosymbiont of Donacia cincticornis]
MKLIFNKKPILKSKTIIFIIISTIIIIIDMYSNFFIKIRYNINNIMSPIYFFLNKPFSIYENISIFFLKNNIVQKNNKYLFNKILQQNVQLCNLEEIKQENNKLKKILKLPFLKDKTNILAKIIPIIFPRCKNEIFIDKGLKDHVSPGTIVLNEQGIVGQIISSKKKSSQVLLICNKNFSLPVQIKNSNITFIINGNGCIKSLKSEYLSTDIIIKKGDVLVTSGLDEQYPQGYPVGTVDNVMFDKEKNFNIVYVKPFLQIEQIKYVLLLINS